MNATNHFQYAYAKRQRGALTLMMAMILLVATTLISIYSANNLVMEQRIAGNEYRALEVEQAASAGLEYALAWLGISGNLVAWTAGTDPACVGSFDELGTLSAPGISAANSDNYNLNIVFCRDTTVANHIVQVTSTAEAASDNSIRKTVRVYARAEAAPVSPGFSGGPLIIGGCLSNVTGSPDVWPAPGGTAIETRVGSGGCINSGGLGLNGGSIDYVIPNAQDMWNYVFNLSRAEIQALAAAEVTAGIPDAQRKYVWISSPANFHRSIGSATNFAVVVFDSTANCPKINGNPSLYGVVFFDSDCSMANGFGGADFYGSAVVNGDVNKLTANSNFYYSSNVTLLQNPSFPLGFAPKAIGTWSDF